LSVFPVSVLLCKLPGRPGAHTKGNPLAGGAIEMAFGIAICIAGRGAAGDMAGDPVPV